MNYFNCFLVLSLILCLGCKEQTDKTDNQFVYLESISTKVEPKINGKKSKTIELKFKIQDGYHIQPNNLDETNFIPTSFYLKDTLDFHIRDIEFIYKPYEWTFDQMEYFDVISSTFKVNVDIEKLKEVGNEKSITAVLYYQACDDRKCYFPRELVFQLPIKE